jgi:hypothetical protein
MPVDWKRYPPNWKSEVVPRIRARSGDKCEWCGAPNHKIVRRTVAGYPEVLEGMAAEVALMDGDKLTYIVLTTAHLGTPHPDGRPGDKHDKMDVRDENLAHLCQRCHLLYDLKDHVANARRTRNRQRGRIDMFEDIEGG